MRRTRGFFGSLATVRASAAFVAILFGCATAPPSSAPRSPRAPTLSIDSLATLVNPRLVGPRAPTSTRLITIDSGSISVVMRSGDTRIIATTPAGNFRVIGDSATLVAWAAAARTLAPPQRNSDGKALLSGNMLRSDDPRASGVMRILRTSTDSLPTYQLDLSNGAWETALMLSSSEAQQLFAAIEGDVVLELPEPIDYTSTAVFTSPYADFELSPARPASGNPSPRYPSHLIGSGTNGVVLVQFIVDTNGRANMSSLYLMSSSNPAFARAVRAVLPMMRFHPAMVAGRPVRQLVQQPFAFRVATDY